jgi:hypothetical protein
MVRICALQPKKRRKNACADLTPPLSLSLSLQGVQARAGMEVSPPANPDHRAGHRWLGVLWMCTPLRVCTPNTPCFTLQPVPVRHSVMITAGCACMCVSVCVCVCHYDAIQLRRTDGAPSRGRPHQRCGTAVAPGCIQEALTSTQQAWGHSVCVDLFRLFFLDGGGNRVWMPPPPLQTFYATVFPLQTQALLYGKCTCTRACVCVGGAGGKSSIIL